MHELKMGRVACVEGFVRVEVEQHAQTKGSCCHDGHVKIQIRHRHVITNHFSATYAYILDIHHKLV